MAKLKIEAQPITLRQGLLIALLAAALIGVLYWPGEETLAPETALSLDEAARPAAAAAKTAHKRASVAPRGKVWPSVDLDEVLRHDPFNSPLLIAQKEAAVAEVAGSAASEAQQEVVLLSLKQAGVHMILHHDDGPVAAVGDRKLKVGDVIDGFRVVAIEMDGVVLERVDSESDAGRSPK